MKGLDTNVLLAWLLDAKGVDTLPGEPPFRVSIVVLAELAWVFGSVYRQSRDEIARIIDALLHTSGLEFDHPAMVARSLSDYRNGKADFADYLLMRDGEAAGCRTTYTYDRMAGRHAGFTLLRKGS